jgi:hypothetical protein
VEEKGSCGTNFADVVCGQRTKRKKQRRVTVEAWRKEKGPGMLSDISQKQQKSGSGLAGAVS